MWELRHRHLLTQVIEALRTSGIPALLFKGTALAYGLYATPASRTRVDSDMLVAAEDRFRVGEILSGLGFSTAQSMHGKYVSYEAGFVRYDASLAHMIDLHWRIHYSQMLSGLFKFDDLLNRSRPLQGLAANALAPCPVDNMLIACLHRSNELNVPQWINDKPVLGSERLIWLYDIYLLAQSFSEKDWEELLMRAAQGGLMPSCFDAITKSHACFGKVVPERVISTLAENRDASIVRYQRGSMLSQKWTDWKVLPGMLNKKAYLLEHIFPPVDYLRERFANQPIQPLLWLYLRRLGVGIARRLRR